MKYELDPKRISEAALQLSGTREFIKKGGEITSIPHDVLQNYKESGIVFASFCMEILLDPEVAEAFLKELQPSYSKSNEICLAISGDSLADSTSIELVKHEAGNFSLDFIDTHPIHKPLTAEERDITEGEVNDRLNYLNNEFPYADKDSWSLSVDAVPGRGYKQIVARRESLPEDIIKDQLFSGFILKIINGCERIEDKGETELLRKEGILHKNPERLLVLTEAFNNAVQIMQSALSPEGAK